MGTFDFCCGLLVPLYAARATEVMLFGAEGATLATANEVRQGEKQPGLGRGSGLQWRAPLPQFCCAYCVSTRVH